MAVNLDKLDNIEYVTYVNRLILKKIRVGITIAPANSKTEKENFGAYYDHVMGKNSSLIEALAQVADIALKIDKQRPKKDVVLENAPTLDEKDMAIINHYMQRHSKEF